MKKIVGPESFYFFGDIYTQLQLEFTRFMAVHFLISKNGF